MEFHSKTGSQATLGGDKRSVRRTNADQVRLGAIVFSSLPLDDDFLFEVSIQEKASNCSDYNGLMIGVTSQRPDLISSLPAYAYSLKQSWILHGAAVYWNHAGSRPNVPLTNLDNLNVGDRVGVMRKSTGALHVYVNGEDKGSVISGVPSGCYAVLDIYGSCVAVSIVNEDAVIKPGMVSIEIVPWPIADFKDRISVIADATKPTVAKARQNKKLKTSAYDDDTFIASKRFKHAALPGFEWFFKIYPRGYGKQAEDFVAVELCVEMSGKKSSATAPSAFFSASLSSANGASTRPISSKLTRFVGKAVCVVERFASREKVETMMSTANDGSVTLSGKIVMETPDRHHAAALRRAFEFGAFSDFTIAVEDEPIEFAVHKVIGKFDVTIAETSPVFMGMLNAELDEVKEGKVTIKESSLDAVKAMLQFIYGDPLCFDGLKDLSIDVLKLAEQYDLSGLKEMCEKALSGMISKANVLQFAQIADLCSAEILKSAVFQFIYDNKEIMTEDAWIMFRTEKCALVVQIQDFIIAKQFDVIAKK